jgi:F0F1-type ATP synthase membrane subunit b/b'
VLLFFWALSRHRIGKKKERTGTGYRMIGGGAFGILWIGCAVVAARAFVVPPTTTSLGTSPSSSQARAGAGALLRPTNRAQKAPPKEKPLRYQESDMWDGKNRMGVVENDMKKVNEQLAYVRQDVAVVRSVVEGLAEEVGIVRKKAEKNKKELTKQAEKNKKVLAMLIYKTKTELTMQAKKDKKSLTMLIGKTKSELTKEIEKTKTELTKEIDKMKTELTKDLTMEINTTKTDLTNAISGLSKDVAGIAKIFEFFKIAFITLVAAGIAALLGIKVNWVELFGWVKNCARTP